MAPVITANEKIEQRLKDLLEFELSLKDGNISASSTLADMDADSLDVASLVGAIEDEFDIEIKDETIGTSSSVKEIVDLIMSEIGK